MEWSLDGQTVLGSRLRRYYTEFLILFYEKTWPMSHGSYSMTHTKLLTHTKLYGRYHMGHKTSNCPSNEPVTDFTIIEQA